MTLFYSAGAAVLVQKVKGRKKPTLKKFADPFMALKWCVKRRIGFVFIPSAPAHAN